MDWNLMRRDANLRHLKIFDLFIEFLHYAEFLEWTMKFKQRAPNTQTSESHRKKKKAERGG